jgi:hypothetical protein
MEGLAAATNGQRQQPGPVGHVLSVLGIWLVLSGFGFSAIAGEARRSRIEAVRETVRGKNRSDYKVLI